MQAFRPLLPPTEVNVSSEGIMWQAQAMPRGGQEGQKAQGQCYSWTLIAYRPKKPNLEDPTSAKPVWIHRDVRRGEGTGPGGGGGVGGELNPAYVMGLLD